MDYKKYKFKDVCIEKGFIRGPFGSALKKSLFVPKNNDAYKVYEQCVPLEQDKFAGDYYISADYFRKSLKRFEVKHNDFLVSCSGVNYGAIYHLQEPFEKGVINQALLIIRINSEIVDYNYFKYLFRIVLSRAITTGTGDSTIPNFPSLDLIKNIDVYLPSLEIQKKIGQILDSIDKKIDTNNTINNNLQAQINSIYNYWFTQYDFPNENGQPYCSSGGKMVWSETLKQNIPENWSVKCVLDILSWQSNSQPPKSKFVYEPKEGYIRFIQNRDYDSDDHLTYIPTSKSLTTCNKKDILIDKYGDAGRVRYGLEGAFNVALAKLKLHDEILLEYVRCYFESEPIYNYLHASCMASTRASLNESNIGNLYIVIPPKEVLDKFNSVVNPMRNNILLSEDENRKCIALRNWLLPMLMNGQATIADS